LQDPISEKNPSQKRAGGMAQGEGLEFKSQYHQKEKKFQQNPLRHLILNHLIS
jgi:hypothetical protein